MIQPKIVLDKIAMAAAALLIAAAFWLYLSPSATGVDDSKGVELSSQSYAQPQDACLDQEEPLNAASSYASRLPFNSLITFESTNLGATTLNDDVVITAESGSFTLKTSANTQTDEGEIDRSLPIYDVYKNGYYVEVSAEIQWMIRDFAEQYGFDEKIIFGCCLMESCFDPSAGMSTGSTYKGLAQIGDYWFTTSTIERFEPTEGRNPFDPYDNLLTMMEMWCYCREAYDIDVNAQSGMKDLLYWHNTGKYCKNVSWSYSELCYDYAAELVTIQ